MPAPIVFYWGGVHTAGGLILRQMRDQGVRRGVHVGRRHRERRVRGDCRTRRRGHADDVRRPIRRSAPEAKSIVDKFLATDYKPEAYTLYSYATVQILKQAIEGSKSLDPKTVATTCTRA